MNSRYMVIMTKTYYKGLRHMAWISSKPNGFI
jgi:hypothetical protein